MHQQQEQGPTVGPYSISRHGDLIVIESDGEPLGFTIEDAFNVGMNLATFAMVVNGGPFPHRENQS